MVYEGSKKRLIITTIWRWVWVGLMGLGTGITVILCGWSSRIQRSILFLQSVSRQGLLKMWMYLISFFENPYRVVQREPPVHPGGGYCVNPVISSSKTSYQDVFFEGSNIFFEFQIDVRFFRFYRHFMTNYRFWTFEILQNWAYYWIHYIF